MALYRYYRSSSYTITINDVESIVNEMSDSEINTIEENVNSDPNQLNVVNSDHNQVNAVNSDSNPANPVNIGHTNQVNDVNSDPNQLNIVNSDPNQVNNGKEETSRRHRPGSIYHGQLAKPNSRRKSSLDYKIAEERQRYIQNEYRENGDRNTPPTITYNILIIMDKVMEYTHNYQMLDLKKTWQLLP